MKSLEAASGRGSEESGLPYNPTIKAISKYPTYPFIRRPRDILDRRLESGRTKSSNSHPNARVGCQLRCRSLTWAQKEEMRHRESSRYFEK
ncbi:hypothetical protein TNCV_1667491 [Trichonephila clavipes]|nr:hypothetical protein TNCV_1667491 [Trichonephila clavipes]